MSRDPDEPRLPKRAGPKTGPKRPAAPPSPGSIREGDETFQPAVSKPMPAKAASKPKRRADDLDSALPETGGPGRLERFVFGSISTAHLAKFCRQFAAYQEAGVDLLKSLTSLERQFARTALGPVLGRLQLAVRRGDALSEAMSREQQVFDSLFLSMVRVAEARGGIPETLRMLANHYEARQRLMRQARSAMIYPVVVLSIASLVIGLLTVFVLPKMLEMMQEMSNKGPASFPLPTRILIGFSAFMQHYGWWAVPLALVGSVFFLLRAYRTPAGKSAIDELCLYIPVLGSLLRKIDTTRFARTLSTLLEAGVDMGTSLDLTADVLHLTPFRRVVRGARVNVVEGSELSDALNASRRFSPDVIAIIGTGEETGKMPETLAKLADDYEEQVTYMVKNLGSLIQPLLMVVLGGFVLFVVVSFVMAYVTMLSNLM
ncbi:MAG: type II secretion system F family protein [Isosphaeraceae bacterium]